MYFVFANFGTFTIVNIIFFGHQTILSWVLPRSVNFFFLLTTGAEVRGAEVRNQGLSGAEVCGAEPVFCGAEVRGAEPIFSVRCPALVPTLVKLE